MKNAIAKIKNSLDGLKSSVEKTKSVKSNQ